MDPKGATHDQRILNSWRHYSPLPDDRDNASPPDSTLLSFKERMATISTVTAEQTWETTPNPNSAPPGPPKPPAPRPTRRRTLSRARMSPWYWTPEILSQLGAILCLTAIILLLWRCDGKPPPKLGLGITLNTVLAFLTSLTKVAFMVPIIEGLGQLKWMWFLSHRRRALIDFQVFEEATRGGLGGAKLLVGFKGWLPSFGALIMMTGLFTSTLTQQAIQYPLVQAVSSNASDVATVDRVTVFSAYDGDKLTMAPYGASRQQQALFHGAFAVPSERIPELLPVCSSGDCNWPPYGSLAICGGVANLTALNDKTLLAKLTTMTEKRLNVLFNATQSTADALGYNASAYFRLVPHVFPLVVGILDKPTGAFNKSVTALMNSDSFIAYTDEPLPNALPFDMSRVRYLEMAYWWCTKTYQTNVTAGKATTVELATRSQLVKPARTLNMPWAPEFYPCYATETCNNTYGGDVAQLEAPPGTANGPAVNYTLHVWSELTASALLATTMFDQVLFDHNRGVVLSNGGGVSKAFGLSLFGDFLSTTLPAPERQLENMQNLVANAARSATNLVRHGAEGVNARDPFAYVNGSVITAQAVVEIHWEWTSMLVAQLVLAGVFLALTIAATSRARMQILKCSSLATLCALDEDARREVGGIGDLEGLDEEARRFGVRLDRDSSGVALSLGGVGGKG